MGTKWTREQRAKFKATMKAKRAQEIPLDAIPSRPVGRRKASKQDRPRDTALILARALVQILEERQ